MFEEKARQVLKELFKESKEYKGICDAFRGTLVERIYNIMGVTFYVIKEKDFTLWDLENEWDIEGVDTDWEEPTELLYPKEVDAIRYFEDIVFDDGIFERVMYDDIEDLVNGFLTVCC